MSKMENEFKMVIKQEEIDNVIKKFQEWRKIKKYNPYYTGGTIRMEELALFVLMNVRNTIRTLAAQHSSDKKNKKKCD